MGTDLRSLRHEYADRGLAEADLADDPVTMFGRWFDDAVDAGIGEPNAMVVSTVSPAGRPSSRMVLLKGYDDDGFVFFTNYASHKASDLAANPACSLLLPWHDLERQVRVDGSATQVAREASEAYFASRPRPSQIGAWASVSPAAQSAVVAGQADLQAAYDAAEQRFDGGDVPCPPTWGGYVVRPDTVEFWQGRRGRMHDRLRYGRDGDGWVVERLAP
jgi:pyridoxamine 5'-phosphate oxidase